VISARRGCANRSGSESSNAVQSDMRNVPVEFFIAVSFWALMLRTQTAR